MQSMTDEGESRSDGFEPVGLHPKPMSHRDETGTARAPRVTPPRRRAQFRNVRNRLLCNPARVMAGLVMAGLVPAIHAVPPAQTSKVLFKGAAWMAGTSPAMT
jgi:hypothetical protein